MDTTRTFGLQNPRESANPISIAVWWWTIGLFKKGSSQLLSQKDLYDPLKVDKAKVLGNRLEKEWNVELKRAKQSNCHPNLLKSIFRTFFSELLILGCTHVFLEFVIRLGSALLLGQLLQYFKEESSTSFEKALIYGSSIGIATGINAILNNQNFSNAVHIGGKLRIALCSVVYRKALRLTKTTLGETAPGKIVNLIASDANKFELVFVFLNHVWSSLFMALIIAYLLYSQAGYAGLIGIIPTIVLVPIQVCLSKLMSAFQVQLMIKTDKRIRLMNEIIAGIHMIKLYAWEKSFCSLIKIGRRLELNVVKKNGYVRGLFLMFSLFIPRMALYSILISMVLFGQDLMADKVYVYAAYLNILIYSMTAMGARGFFEANVCVVAVRRFQKFLMLEEVHEIQSSDFNVKNNSNNTTEKFRYIDKDKNYDDHITKNNESTTIISNRTKKIVSPLEDDTLDTPSVGYAIKLKHITTKWNVQSSDPILDDVNLNIEKGKLYIVIGTVGAGKSSFFSTILVETNIIEGSIEVNGNISFADQDSWIFGSTVRQNILFGQDFDKERYQRVVKACALLPDFKQFPQGDLTVVGERGSSLSGGQKARINLARSVYREADIYLLDDPLSAVDSLVGKHLFEECFLKHLVNKTRILATHQLQYITNADAIILVEQRKTYKYNNYLDLLSSHPEYNCLIANNEKTEDKNLRNVEHYIQHRLSSSSITSLTSDTSETQVHKNEENKYLKDEAEFYIRKSQDHKNNNLILEYFKIGSNALLACFVLLVFILTQLMASLTDLFVPILITADESRIKYNDLERRNINDSNLIADKSAVIMNEENTLPLNHCVYIYTGLILLIFLLGFSRSFFFYGFCTRCSQRLHDLVFGRLIRTNMLFFDTNPSGKILNRFSTDLGSIDEIFPRSMMEAGHSLLITIGSLIIPCIINQFFLIPVVIIGIPLYYWIRKFYFTTIINIKRMEGTTRSPVFTHLNTTLNGISTIRAYKAQEMLMNEFSQLQDEHTSAWYMLIVCNSAFGFLLDFYAFILTSLFIFSFILFKESGQVGLALSQMLVLIGAMLWGVRQSAEVINHTTAIERVLEYKDLEPEPNLRDMGEATKSTKKAKKGQIALNDVPKDWPKYGTIKFNNVHMCYAEGKPVVLKNVTFTIRPGEKIGIVGRTGAGKSSLITALFRLAKVEGVIEIDEIDTGTIALEDLRSRLSIIPQDPVLFSGTLRYNLDPFNEFPDEILWKVLNEVELKDTVLTCGNILDAQIYDHGTNFSVGQRQLVCLARAILRNNQILMMDEATANVDPHTDILIQRTIRTKFPQCTVLTIAHRLNTIIDSDRVIVMGNGELLEFDHPHLLLQNERSHFTTLVKETGPAMFEQLRKIAQDSYLIKYENDQQ